MAALSWPNRCQRGGCTSCAGSRVSGTLQGCETGTCKGRAGSLVLSWMSIGRRCANAVRLGPTCAVFPATTKKTRLSRPEGTNARLEILSDELGGQHQSVGQVSDAHKDWTGLALRVARLACQAPESWSLPWQSTNQANRCAAGRRLGRGGKQRGENEREGGGERGREGEMENSEKERQTRDQRKRR